MTTRRVLLLLLCEDVGREKVAEQELVGYNIKDSESICAARILGRGGQDQLSKCVAVKLKEHTNPCAP